MVRRLKAQNSLTYRSEANAPQIGRAGNRGRGHRPQVGLFCGPAYTIYKALTAVRLAQRLSNQGILRRCRFFSGWPLKITTSPKSATCIHSIRRDGRCVSNSGSGGGEWASASGGASAGGHPPLMELRESLKDFPYRAEVAAMVEESYAPGATLTQAFRKLLGKILGDGAVDAGSADPAIRTIARPFLEAALRAAPDVKTASRARARIDLGRVSRTGSGGTEKLAVFPASRAGSGRRCARRMPSSRRLRIERRRFRQTHCCVR